VFKRQKTGPLPFNVEYTLSVLRCKKRALTAAELAAVAESVTIDQKFIRATPEEVKATLERITTGAEEDAAPEGTDQEAINDLNV
jgi:hypothetical protein